MAFTRFPDPTNNISNLANQPVEPPATLKQKFDQFGEDSKDWTNNVFLPELESTTNGDSGADNIGATALSGGVATTVQGIVEELDTKAVNGVSALNTHKGSADHDGRYFTEAETTALLLANQTGNHLGTWQGYNPVQSDPGIQAIVNEHTQQLIDIQYNVFLIPASWGLNSITNDGTVADANRAQALITYATTNNKRLYFPTGTYNFAKGFAITNGKGSVEGQESPFGNLATIFNFTQTDGTDCFSISGSTAPHLKNIKIQATATSGYGIKFVGSGGSFQWENLFIQSNSNKECLYLTQTYIVNLYNIKCEKYKADTKTVLFENVGLIGLFGCNFINVAINTQPTFNIKNSNTVCAYSININGGKGVLIESCDSCFIEGYHEFGVGDVLAIQVYSAFLDSKTSTCKINTQSIAPVIDLGSNNEWKYKHISTNYIPVNPKKIIYNVKNSCFDEEAIPGGMSIGTVTTATIESKSSLFSSKSIKVTIPAGETAFRLIPSNAFQDLNYNLNKTLGNQLTLQLSIYSDYDYIDSSLFKVRFGENGASGSLNQYAFVIPYAKKVKTYGFSVPAEANGQGWIEATFFNNTGSPVILYLSDIVFTQNISSMPDFLSQTPTDGMWINKNVFPKSDVNGGFNCTASGVFKTITAATCDVVSNSRSVTLVTGNISDFAVGDFIQIAVTGNPKTRIWSISGNTITIGNALSYNGTGVALTIANPTFTTY